MKYAIIESGGKQYKAVEGETIEVDRLAIDIGKKVDISDVLLIADGESVTVGSPTVSGAKVKTTVVDQIRAPKIIVFKYHPRKRYRLKRGHRQKYTLLKIESINAKAAPKAKTTAKTKAKTPVAKEATATKTTAKTAKPKTTAKKTETKKTSTKKTAIKKTATKKTAAKKTADKKTAAKKKTTKKTSTDKK